VKEFSFKFFGKMALKSKPNLLLGQTVEVRGDEGLWGEG